MKKILAIVVILLAAAIASAPYINGIVMEKIVRQAQGDVNARYGETGSGINVEIMNYDRSYATSKIEWRIRLGRLGAVYGIDEILLVDHAKHGLTGVVSKTSLERNQWFTDFINTKLDGKNPLHITTFYKLTGNIESFIDIDAFSPEAEKETVEFRPASIITEINEDFKHLTSTTTWEGFSLADKARLDGFTVKSDLKKITTYIWQGEIDYGIDHLAVNDRQANFALNDFKGKYSLDFNREKNTLSIGLEAALTDLEDEKGKIQNAFARIEINNLDARGYEEFMEIYSQSMQPVLNDISNAQDDSEKMEQAMKGEMANAGLQMMTAYEKFLKKGLEILITDVHMHHPTGNIEGNLELKLNRDVTFAQLVPIVTQPGLAFDIFSLHSHLSFPEKLAGDKYNQLISPVYPGMQTGLFVVDGENLVHNAETRDGKLFLNDLEVVLD